MEKTFAHSVFFWLKTGLSKEERAAFEKGAKSLLNTPGTRYTHLGTPAPTNRPVIDFSYDYNLVLVFDDAAKQDAYQTTDANHQNFISSCKQYWDKVLIYDSLSIDAEPLK